MSSLTNATIILVETHYELDKGSLGVDATLAVARSNMYLWTNDFREIIAKPVNVGKGS